MRWVRRGSLPVTQGRNRFLWRVSGTRWRTNATATPGSAAVGHHLRPDFPFPFDDWIEHSAGSAQSRPSVTARRSSLWAPASPVDRRLRTDEAGVKPVVYEASQLGGGCVPSSSRAPRSEWSPNSAVCAFRRRRPPFTTTSTCSAGDTAVPQPADRRIGQHGHRH